MDEKFQSRDGSYFEYIILNTSLKKHGIVTNNPSIKIYVNKIENKITFRRKTGYCIEL